MPNPQVTNSFDELDGKTLITTESEAFFNRVKVVLTNAQIKALQTTPITIVFTPGVDKLLIFLKAVGIARITTPYTNINDPSYMSFRWIGGNTISNYLADASDTDPVLAGITAFLGTAGNRVAVFETYTQEVDPANDDWGNTVSIVGVDSNSGFQLHLTNSSGDLTGGDDSNTLTIYLYYNIIDLLA